jgi:uncharacterized protein (TIGR03083 family)
VSTPQQVLYGDALRSATERLASVGPAHHDLAVAACPGWTVSRLKVHVGRIHRWVAVALDTPDDRDVPAVARPPAGTDLSAWLIDGVGYLLEAFERAGDQGAVHSPGWQQPAHWWLRRCTHETVIHAWDAQAAVGVPQPISADIACDGIDEVLEVFVPTRFDMAAFGPAATIHLHGTDQGLPNSSASPNTTGEWLVHIGPDGTTVDHTHAKGDVAVRAGVSDLMLLLWNRVDAQYLEVFGDTDILERYRQSCRF